MSRLCALTAWLAVAACWLATATPALASIPPIRHVFVIVLENESASTTFGPGSKAPYLSTTLRAQGAYLPNYHATGHQSNDNYVSMISGQAPNALNQADCQFFTDFPSTATGADGQQQGAGCVYPSDVQTVAGQLGAAGLTWRDYNQSMGNTPTREAAECGHPAVGGRDGTQSATAQDMYATRHDPFVYFHSIIDDTTLCDSHVVNLNLLGADLSAAAQTPNYVFITPDLCSDGHDAPCADGQPGGLVSADAFLKTWVPKITASPAFVQQNGLLIITFDEASTSDASSCCGEIPGPGSPQPGVEGGGGGDVGAVMLSPCIKPGTVSIVPYDHYTMLRSVEDVFGLSHLGYAGLPGGQSFGSDIFTGPCSQAAPVVTLRLPRVVGGRALRPAINLRWSATGTGVRFRVQVRRLLDGRRPTRWRTLIAAGGRTSLRYRAARAQTYQFRVRATDRTGRASAWSRRTVRVLRGRS
jgi:hypothetical protein